MTKEESDAILEKFQAKLNAMTEEEIKEQQLIYDSSNDEDFECNNIEIIYPENATRVVDGEIDQNNEPVIIRNWTELSKTPQESETHRLQIDLRMCCGHIRSKSDLDFRRYLSTHTFYNKAQHEHATKLLQSCGFNVIITD